MNDKSVGIIPVYMDGKDILFLHIHQAIGHWGFPKGHPNPGENELETALRELREETGIKKCAVMDNFRYVQNYSFEKDGSEIKKEVVFFIGLVEKDNILLDKNEVQASKWLDYEQSLRQLSYEESRNMMKFAFKFLKKEKSATRFKE